MLLAEIRGKLKGTFGCVVCGSDGISPEAAVAIEDALTSSTFGALRWLRPELGLLSILRLLELPYNASDAPTVSLWPWDRVPVVSVGEEAEMVEVGCEPDAVIDLPGQGLVLVEVKLGAVLGADPLQLPKEAVFAHRLAHGRPWRLLCITTGTTAPRIQGFRLDGDRLVLTDRLPLADAVASYFSAVARQNATATSWPSSSEVKAAVRWLPWSSLGALFATARAKFAAAPHEHALLDDVVALLRRRGLMRAEFHGFELTSVRPLKWSAGLLWRRSAKPLWHIQAKVSPWPALKWLSHAIRARTGFQGFGTFSAKQSTKWPKFQWLSTRRRRR
jgi:hypothetical protein